MAERGKKSETGLRKVWGVLCMALFLFSLLGLLSYDWSDISLLQNPPNDPPCNLIGLVGAWLSYGLFGLLGVGAYLTPLWCLVTGLILMLDEEERAWPRVAWASVLLLVLSLTVELDPDMWSEAAEKLNIAFSPGGIAGWLLMRCLLVQWLSPVGAGILIWSIFFAALMLMVGPGNISKWFANMKEFSHLAAGWMKERVAERQDRRSLIEREERQLEKQRQRLEKQLRLEERQATRTAVLEDEEEVIRQEEKQRKPAPAPKKRTEPSQTVMAVSGNPNYRLPPMDLLEKGTVSSIKVDSATTSRIMIETLEDFGIKVEVTNVEKGPVVTRYELLPAPGVRIERIAGLANNLALSLKAHSVRVQAPIPGKGVVGIEVPNASANMVRLRDIVESEAWSAKEWRVPLALGKDVGGNDIVADLAEMPHMLVAGATGAGKTVCMNSLLAGLLLSKSPDELKLMLVDPKIVEFSIYNNLPHLVVPVITDPKKVALGLRWAINEMEKRYKLFAKAGVRNIESFNHREVATQEELFSNPDAEPDESQKQPARIPYIVIVIDELADLMLADQAEIENCVARLAQLSRAVGIHMILSTQRPSVNVITGTIKANFPSRVAFQVAQKTDSRTILDATGAEKLLGRGDMLFLPPGASKMIRVQGAMTSDAEIKNITDFIKKQSGPNFDMEITERIEKSGVGKMDGGEEDELLAQAIEIIRETRRASTSSLQRRLRIGYTRAARMIDILEERGILGPPRGSDPREILVDLDGEIPNNRKESDAVPGDYGVDGGLDEDGEKDIVVEENETKD